VNSWHLIETKAYFCYPIASTDPANCKKSYMKSPLTTSIKLFIAILIPVLVFTTCKKEADTLETYVSERCEIRPIRLFTTNGEIQDQNLIGDFISRHTAGHNFQIFITNYDTIIDTADDIKIEYLSSNTAMLTHFGVITQRNIIEKKDYLIFESLDTNTIYLPITNETLVDFFENLFVYKPLYSEFQQLPLSTGFRGLTKLKPCYFLEKKNNNELSSPGFFIMHIRYYDPGIPEQRRIFGLNNDFNTSAVQYLNEGDTIAVQQSAVILKKMKL